MWSYDRTLVGSAWSYFVVLEYLFINPSGYDLPPFTFRKEGFIWTCGSGPVVLDLWFWTCGSGPPFYPGQAWLKVKTSKTNTLTDILVYQDMVNWKTSVLHYSALFWWKHILFHYPRRREEKAQEVEPVHRSNMLTPSSCHKDPLRGFYNQLPITYTDPTSPYYSKLIDY